MIKTALLKDIFRDIRKSLGRFLSITLIIALGVAFFTGLTIAPEDMKRTADKYYDDYNLMDIRIVSNLGLTEDDLEEVRKIEGIETVEAAYSLDVLVEYEDNELVVKVHSLPSDHGINRVRLMEGRLPEGPDECVIEKGMNGSFLAPIGSKIKLSSGTDDDLGENLKNTEYTVVGMVQTPYYLSFQKGSSNIGNGQVKGFIMVTKDNFKLDVYTDIYLTVEGAKELYSYGDEYFPLIDKVTARLKDLAKERENIRYQEIVNEAMEELEKGKREYFEEKEKAEKELADALKEIEDGKEEIAKGERELNNRERDFQKSIREGKEKLSEAEEELIRGEKEFETALKEFEEKKALALESFKLAEEEISKGEKAIEEMEIAIDRINLALSNPLLAEEERAKLNLELENLTGLLTSTRESVEAGKRELEGQKLQLSLAEEELTKTKELLESSRRTLELEREKLLEGEREGLRELRKAKEELEKAKLDLAKGEEEYLEAKEKAERELKDAWEEIEKAEKEIQDIEKAKWYVLDRNSHYSFVDYKGAADRIEALSKVFPLFFVLVAALVCLTTMTRMVDEQRVNIGTLKALGYGKVAIAFKYIIYSFSASILGSILGIAVGFTVFPTVIFNAYGIMYMLPPVKLYFDRFLALATTLVAIGLTTITSYMACSNELKENTAALLRPKAPKAGKRILLERIPLIWNRLNFSGKVTVRNIFRYKRRFFMTVIGVAGCTALILTAYGIRDSIRDVVNTQFGELLTYDISIGLDSDEVDLNDNRILDYELISKEGGTISSKSISKDINIVVPQNLDNIHQYIKLRDRKTKSPIYIEKKGAVITEQLSRSLDLKVGDEALLKNSDDKEVTIQITGISENYLYNYVYLSNEYYEELFHKKLEYKEALGIIREKTKEFEDRLSKDLLNKEGIKSVNFNTVIKDDFEDTIHSLNYVVMVMILSAGTLAFVVLYNLTNVNISERIREIATIKVLGFYDREVSVYIYRENTVLTVIGTLIGLILGVFLHRYIMTTVEMDNIMFGLDIELKSYIISIIMTLGFAIFVNFAMYYKLKNVKMVESLKSVD